MTGMPRLTHVPDLPALEALVATAEAGSMGAAAERLGMSQQAVSARIRAAETLLGVAVFRRSPRGVDLTPSGQVVITWAADVLLAAGAMESGVMGLRAAGADIVKVAASNTISEALLPSWAARLRARHPQAQIRAVPGNSLEVLAAVQSAEVDLGFVECPQVPRSVASQTVGRDRLVVVVAPDHPWASRRRGVTRAELARTPLVLREPGSGTRQTLEKAIPDLAPPLLEVRSTAACRSVIATAGAASVLSSLATRGDVEAGRLVEVDLIDLDLPRRLRAVWNPRQRPRGLAAELLALASAR